MQQAAALTRADMALHALRDEAAFAEARYGRAHGETLMHYHRLLTQLLTLAFEEHTRGGDRTLPARDRAGMQAHACDVADHIVTDVEALRERYRRRIDRQTPTGPGARAALEAAGMRAAELAETWWEGRMRLGTVTATAVAARDWKSYRPLPRWVPWAGGASAAIAVATPIVTWLT